MSWYCAEMHLPVAYAESRRELDTDAFLRSIQHHLESLRNGKDREWARGILQEIRHARRFVLNPNAHYYPELEEEISAEIGGAVRTVEEFDLLLRCVQTTDFAETAEELKRATVSEMVHAAIENLALGNREAALDALGRAFEQHLDEWFRLRNELVPYGEKTTRKFLFDWAGRQHLFSDLTWRRLKHAKPFFLSEISGRAVQQQPFEFAVRLLLELRMLFLLGKIP